MLHSLSITSWPQQLSRNLETEVHFFIQERASASWPIFFWEESILLANQGYREGKTLSVSKIFSPCGQETCSADIKGHAAFHCLFVCNFFHAWECSLLPTSELTTEVLFFSPPFPFLLLNCFFSFFPLFFLMLYLCTVLRYHFIERLFYITVLSKI